MDYMEMKYKPIGQETGARMRAVLCTQLTRCKEVHQKLQEE